MKNERLSYFFRFLAAASARANEYTQASNSFMRLVSFGCRLQNAEHGSVLSNVLPSDPE